MSEFLDYNPDRGTYYETDPHGDGIAIHTMQDVQPVLDYCKARRNSGEIDKGIKKGFWHYATIPAHVELEIKEKFGVSLYNKGATKDILKIINRHYPYLKNTTLHHE